MARNLRKFDTYNDYETADLIRPAVSLVAATDKVYFDPTRPTCYEVIPYSISAYSSTTYDSVYSYTDGKWYMLNNLNNYEPYGIYDTTGSSLSDYTYYDGKLVVVGTTEYQRSGDTWVEVGTYESTEVTYPINDSNLDDYVGMELSTTFKIPVADVEGWLDLRIRTSDEGNLEIGTDRYIYNGFGWEEGTVTNDGTYYNYSLPTTESITIQRIEYWNSETIHIIVGGMQVSVEYSAKTAPSSALTYSSISEMFAVGCPTVGVGQYCYTNGNTYKFTSNQKWTEDSNIFVKAFNIDGTVRVLPCGFNNNVLDVGVLGNKYGTAIENPNREVVIGDCVTSLGEFALGGMRGLSACTIGSGVTSIGNRAFQYDTELTNIVIPSGVTSIGDNAFDSCSSIQTLSFPNSVTTFGGGICSNCTNLTSVTFGNNVLRLGGWLFRNCSKLLSVTFNTVTPPEMTYANSFEGSSCTIYVPAASVNLYKSAYGWYNYASRIQAIPNS